MTQTISALEKLQLKDREIAIIAALVALGDKGRSHFAMHITAALDAGARRQQIVEMIGTLSQCSGSPTAMSGAAAAIKIFEERDATGTALSHELPFEPGDAPTADGNDARFVRAQEVILNVYPAGPTDDTYTSVARLAPHMWRNIATFFYNDFFLHPGLDLSTRELGIFSNLSAMGSVPLQAKWHAHGALNNGWTGEQLAEAIEAIEPYIGYATAFEAAIVLAEVLQSRDESRPKSTSEAPRAFQDFEPDRAIRIVGKTVPGLVGAIDQDQYADLRPGGYFDARDAALLSLTAVIVQGASPALVRIETENALAAGVSDLDIRALLPIAAKIAGVGIASRAEHSMSEVFVQLVSPNG